MEIRLVQLSGTNLEEALKIEYVSIDEEENFVIGAKDSFKDYSDIIRWIQIETSGSWINCGMIAYGLEKDKEFPGFWIQRLMIHPDFRKKKIATQAIKLALKEVPLNTPVYTSTVVNNVNMKSLLEKLGFVNIPVIDWEDEMVYKLK